MTGSGIQRDLYLANRQRLKVPTVSAPAVDAFEQRWIEEGLNALPAADDPATHAQLMQRLATLIEQELQAPQDGASYVASSMTRDEFGILVQEFAVDGLTEAQAFYFIMPRLSLEAQMPMLRIMIDEFGSGNLKRAHTSLYLNLLNELNMPTALDYYVDRVEPACLGFVNFFFWLTLRADDASYFAGAITYLETIIPSFFECYTAACKRLGIQAHAYYSEHQHIDAFHAIEGQRLLKAMEDTGTLDAAKAWRGAQLASLITATAFDAALAKARLAHPPLRVDDYQEEGYFTAEVAGQRYRVPQFCPHRGGRLAHGYINATCKTIACPLHHSVFSLETGEQIAGPACGRLCVEPLGRSAEDGVQQ